MTLVEGSNSQKPDEQIPTDAELEARAEALHGESYLRMRRIKEAAGRLSHAFFAHGDNSPKTVAALAEFDDLVYPPGINSVMAAEAAPAFRFVEDDSGALHMQQVDPRTNLPMID